MLETQADSEPETPAKCLHGKNADSGKQRQGSNHDSNNLALGDVMLRHSGGTWALGPRRSKEMQVLCENRRRLSHRPVSPDNMYSQEVENQPEMRTEISAIEAWSEMMK